jgi:hypothetical protein
MKLVFSTFKGADATELRIDIDQLAKSYGIVGKFTAYLEESSDTTDAGAA